MQIFLFGHFRVLLDGQPVPDEAWRGHMPRTLVQYLATRPGHRATIDELTEALWGHLPPEKGRQNLRVVATYARTALGGNLPFHRHGYELPPGAWIDLEAVYHPLADGGPLPLPDELLTEQPYADWAEAVRREYGADLPGLELANAAHLSESGRPREALARLTRLLALDPANEPVTRQAMSLAFALGDRAGALQIYERCRQALADDLGLDPLPATTALHAEILLADDRPALRQGEGRVPAPMTSFIGREEELAAISQVLLRQETRLVTLTGSGGAGKTRLALETARRRSPQAFPDGVWFVDLSPVTEGLPRAVAAALGLPPDQADLAAFLSARRTLLILDNCEQITADVARLAKELLSACPGLKLLATSRHALSLLGESVWRVPELSPAEAAALFCERAAAVSPAAALDRDAVAEICQRLDYIPLAIELAAARAHVLPVAEIASRLADRFRLLRSADPAAPPRQQTLRGAMDWSHDLLTAAEQMAWRRLSVFVGGFTLAAAEAVCAAEAETLDLLQALIDKSLLRTEMAEGLLRYRMLETVREYGAERLVQSGEADAVRTRHLAYYLRFAREVEPKLSGPEQIAWCDRLEAELGNIRAALGWARESGQAESGLWVAACLTPFWYARNYVREGIHWLEQFPGAAEARSRALSLQAFLTLVIGDSARARPLAEAGLAVASSASLRERSLSEIILGVVAVAQGDFATARIYLDSGLGTQRAIGEDVYSVTGMLWCGIMARMQSDLAGAVAWFDRGIATGVRIGDLSSLAACLIWRGRLAVVTGDYATARRLLQEGLPLYWRMRNKQFTAAGLSCLGLIALAEGDPHTAARLLGATDALLDSIALPLLPHLRAEYDQARAGARRLLAEAEYNRAYGEGAAMNPEAAIALALGGH